MEQLKLDKRKNYYLTLDTETANGLDDSLVYDIGGAIHDKKGNILETFSFIIYDVFVLHKDIMNSAYYADKIPNYEIDLKKKNRKMVTLFTARKHIKNLCEKYNVKAIIAYNARFDYMALNTSIRYLTKSKIRYFLPYGVPVWCSLKMAQDTICKQVGYNLFCEKNEYKTKTNRLKSSAEIVYRYMIGNNDFVESHTGLEDVVIEVEIFAHALRQHKAMRKTLFKNTSRYTDEKRKERGWEIL